MRSLAGLAAALLAIVLPSPCLAATQPAPVEIGERVAARKDWMEAGRSCPAEVVDASGCIVIPGLVNAHMHTWQTALRGVAGNWTILEYFRHVHAGLATQFRPEDIRIATLCGALNQLNCGTTTLVDWCPATS